MPLPPTSSFTNIPHDSPQGYRTAYQQAVFPDELGTAEIDGKHRKVTFQYVLKLLEEEVCLSRVGHPYEQPIPYDAAGRPMYSEEVLLRQSPDDFLADSAPMQNACRRWFDASVLAEAHRILQRARTEGKWRTHLHIRNTDAVLDATLTAMRAGRRIEHGVSCTDITYRYDAERDTWVDHSVTTNPYTNAQDVREQLLSEDGMRAILQSLSDAELRQNLR